MTASANPFSVLTRLQVPPLENGDLTREFERRYNAMPHYKAELIEGTVYMASPALNPMPNHTAISSVGYGLQNCRRA